MNQARTIEAIVEDLLFGPTIEDAQHMIEPNGRRRLVKQAFRPHRQRDCVRCLCLDCGRTDDARRLAA